MRLVLHSKVYSDIDEIMGYYERVATPGLAEEFYTELRYFMTKAADKPESFSIREYDQVKRLVDKAAQTYGRIDVMINNAGLMPQSPLERLKIDEWDRMIDVNIKGVLYGKPKVL